MTWEPIDRANAEDSNPNLEAVKMGIELFGGRNGPLKLPEILRTMSIRH